ncbi:IclR family transcriptional regulator [Shewanella algidipiscicola]|uniref:IclR family transcriptional regulator n=2 Tax=Shewanella algidipiscicola TaxID=614070 RepID=A0ABQ4PNL2_9GAMM|nr:IclR family transcriptional regulator [Shewanella algidipiscicola]
MINTSMNVQPSASRDGVSTLSQLITEIKCCQLCRAHLPPDARPIIQAATQAKILLAGQAPGRAANQTGVPFNDASGERLRQWLGVSHEQFYDEQLFAILPMAFCYPGKGKNGDLPPRPECADMWRQQLLSQLTQIKLTLVMGQYAQAYHCPTPKGSVALTLTQRVRNSCTAQDAVLPLPHPSPLNNRWLKANPWFGSEVLPTLKQRVAEILAG